MPRWSYLRFISLPIILLICMLTACQPRTEIIQIGTNVWPGYEPLYLAEQYEFFPRQTRLVQYPSASEVLRAYRHDLIQMAAVTLDESLLLWQYQPDFQVILLLDFSSGGDVLLGNPGLNSIQALRGRRVGVENTALGAYMLFRSLEHHNLRPEDVHVVALEVDGHESAYLSGSVDALITFEPVKSRLMKRGARVLFHSGQIEGEIVDVLICRSRLINQNPEAVQQVVAGWYRAIEYQKKYPHEVAPLLAARESISADEYLNALEGLKFPDPGSSHAVLSGTNPQLLSTYSRIIDFLGQRGELKQEMPDPTRFFRSDFVKRYE
ncbi:MAG: ABC transporter substrate-binding protein [Leptospiraceae bacterium]|nr:ABC transporter substrate-binding protein [Leptospiraceae bacterium]